MGNQIMVIAYKVCVRLLHRGPNTLSSFFREAPSVPPKTYAKATFFPSKSQCVCRFLIASCMVCICMETADNTASSNLLNSSKHPHAPHLTNPVNIRPIDFTSIPSSQLNTST